MGIEIPKNKNLILGKNAIISKNVELGVIPRNAEGKGLKLKIGDNAVIRSGTVIYA
jgi:hypothetical protein